MSLRVHLSWLSVLLAAACAAEPRAADASLVDGGALDATAALDAASSDAPPDTTLWYDAAALGGWMPPPNEPYPLDELPSTFPRPAIPDDEPLTRPRVELGRHLFYDTRLSGSGTQACASCHEQARAFTDGRTTPLGSTGETGLRNALTLANVGYVSALTWASRLQGSLSRQALIPMFGEAPVELGLAGREVELLERLRAEPRYRVLFPLAFPDEADPITVHDVTVALAAFQRTILSYRSAYDRFAYGHDTSALDESAQRGMSLFYSERFECFHCHGGFAFSISTRHDGTTLDETSFQNTGLYNVDGRGAYPARDTGLMRVTTDARDMGAFRAPTLRNIELTAPYFHDGSAATLDDVLDHYSRGGRAILTGPDAGDGAESPLKSGFVHGIGMTPGERADLVAFLHALTDHELTVDPRWSSPW